LKRLFDQKEFRKIPVGINAAGGGFYF